MKNRKFRIVLCTLSTALFLLSCTPTPSAYRGYPKEYSLAYEEIYGHCYDSVEAAVVALDLYSDGLEMTEDHRIKGTGYNLYLSDIFVPDSLLEEGSYRSELSGASFTFLPGRDYEGTPTGMYLLYIEEDKLQSIQMLDSGTFIYRNDSLLFTLYYRNAYGSKAIYKPTFHGTLLPWLKR